MLTDRVYFFKNRSVTAAAGCPVLGGIILSPVLGTLLVVYPRGITVASLETGAVLRSLQFSDFDRDCLAPTDFVTAVAADALGKKCFVGSNLGFVYVLDVGSVGALRCLHSPDTPNESAVVSLTFFPFDEALIAVFSSGTIKVLPGTFRLFVDTQDPLRFPSITPPLPLWDGGRQVPMPRSGFFEYNAAVILSCASEELGLVATSSSDGVIRVFDAAEMRLKGVYLTPVEQDNMIVHCHAICFVEGRPALVGVDGNARVTVWAVHPERPRCLVSCRISPVDLEASLNEVKSAEIVVSGQRRSWIFVGDEMGALWVIDITGLWGNSKPKLTRHRSSFSMLSKRALNEEEKRSIEKMMREPVGMHATIIGGKIKAVDVTSRASFQKIVGASLGGRFTIVRMSHPFASSVRCIAVLREGGAPTHVVAASDRGIVKLFKLDGEELGEMHSVSLVSGPVESVDLVDNSRWGYKKQVMGGGDRVGQMVDWLAGLHRPLLPDEWGANLPQHQTLFGYAPITPSSPALTEHAQDVDASLKNNAGDVDGYETWKYILTNESSEQPRLSQVPSKTEVLQLIQEKRLEAEARSRKRIFVSKLWGSKVRFPHLHSEELKKSPEIGSSHRRSATDPSARRETKLDEMRMVGMGFEEDGLNVVDEEPVGRPQLRVTVNSPEDVATRVTSPLPTVLSSAGDTRIDNIIVELEALESSLKDTPKTILRSQSSTTPLGSNSEQERSIPVRPDQSLVDKFTQLMQKQDRTQPLKLKERPRSAFANRTKLPPKIGVVVDIEEREEVRLRALLTGKKQQMVRAARGRFGPYELQEILNFVRFTYELRPGDGSWYFEDGTHFSRAAILSSQMIAEHSRFVQAVQRNPSNSSGTLISRRDLVQLIFEHATKAERARIGTLAALAQSLWRLLDSLRPPSLNSVPIPPFTKKHILAKRIALDLSVFPRRIDFSAINSTKGFEGWIVPQDYLLEVCSIFEAFMKSPSGTCFCKEFPLMLQNYAEGTTVKQFLRMNDSLERNALAPDTEVDGSTFLSLCANCLKLRMPE